MKRMLLGIIALILICSGSATIADPAPTIASFTPGTGAKGANVTITGANFTGATAVKFNGVAATSFSVISSTSITAVVPKTSTGKITVKTPSATATSATSFTFIPAPTISSRTPSKGAPGTIVTISGSNFTGTNDVKFNGVSSSSFTIVSSKSIRASAPSSTTGAISVTNPGGTAASSSLFYYPPTIASFTPTFGAAGTVVTITGTNFTGATAVKYNGTSATSFTIVNPTTINATAPKALVGFISVTTPGGTAISSSSFFAAPTISSLTPGSGPAGTKVTINGTNFTGVTALKFNGVDATSYAVLSSTSISAIVPTTTTGKVSVTTTGGTATSFTSFVFIQSPTIASFTPAFGVSGTKVTITGTNFSSVAGVKFNGIAASYSVLSATSISATAPKATAGPITVTTNGGTATSANPFYYPPTITTFTPSSGGMGTVVTITGTSFTGATAVKFNSISATSFTVVSPTSITAVVPNTTIKTISVTTPGGTATSSTTLFPAPTISSFTPTTGEEGTKVTVYGTNFTGTTAVKFNGIPASSFTVASATSITAFVPANPTTGRVTVTTPGGTATSPSPFTVVNSRAGVMLYIPAGNFLMGNSGVGNDAAYANASELPQRSVYLNGYYISKYEVTRGQFKQFINAGGYTNQFTWSVAGWAWRTANNRTQPQYWAAIQNWGTGTFTQTDNHPVVGVSYYEAEAYCKWAGCMLPTEAQWEKAARWTGSQANVYPWSDVWNADKCNTALDTLYAGNQTSPVGSYAAYGSPYGCQDMAGNAWEWCQDWYKSYSGSTSPFDYTNTYKVLRGGSWYGSDNGARCAFRYNLAPSNSGNLFGFRMVK